MSTLKDLDSQINQLFREQEALQVRGEGGEFVEGKGWVGTSPRYRKVLAELVTLTRQRMQEFQYSNSLIELGD